MSGRTIPIILESGGYFQELGHYPLCELKAGLTTFMELVDVSFSIC